jgi:hypothetical protein
MQEATFKVEANILVVERLKTNLIEEIKRRRNK